MSEQQTPLSEQFHQSSGSYELVLSAVILGLFGLFLDRRIGSTPFLTVGFTIAGFIGAGLSIYYRYTYRIRQIQAETAALKAARPGSGRG